MAERLSGGNAGLALLANAIATGGALVALILTFGPISGAHFNPAVTAALALHGFLAKRLIVPYAAAQTAGAIVGVWLAHLMFDLPILQTSLKARTGIGQWAGEFTATFGLLTLILVAVRRHASAIPYAVASYIVGAYWFTSSTSFANPAVTMRQGPRCSATACRRSAIWQRKSESVGRPCGSACMHWPRWALSDRSTVQVHIFRKGRRHSIANH
jgi:glycerol uptake facilitator-like aquaporin